MVMIYKLTARYKERKIDTHYILLPEGISIEDALKLLGIKIYEVVVTLEAIG